MKNTLAATTAWIAAFVLLTGCSSLKNGDSKWSLDNLFSGENSSSSSSQSDDDFDVFGERNPDRLMLADLGPGRIGTTLKTRLTGGGQDRAAAEKAFAEAQQIYKQAIGRWENDLRDDETESLFKQAANRFEVAGDRWPDSALEQDALFMQGESHFFANQYVLANRAFEILLNRYSGTSKLDLVESRRFEIAQYWLALGRKKTTLGVNWSIGDASRPSTDLAGQARRILHRIRLDDPTGKLADDATVALANAFFEAKRYSDAADAYEDLRRTYPGSPHQFHAHIFELRARLAAYRGANYDGTDLEKANELMKTLVRQFPAEMEKQRDYLAREAKRIRNLLAERDWSLGEYYEARGENRAAGYYYEQVAKNYSDSKFSQEARERVASLTGKPPVPAQKAEWLVNLFPEKEINKPLIATGNRESILR